MAIGLTQIGGLVGNSVVDIVHTTIPVTANIPNWQLAAALLIASLFVSWLTSTVLSWFVHLLARKTKTETDDILVKKLKKPVTYIIFSLLIYVALSPLNLTEGSASLLDSVLMTINILAFAFFAHRLSSAAFQIWKTSFAHKTKSELDDTMLPLLSKFTAALIWVITFILVLGSWGVEVGPFLAGLGIAGIAIGFAVKDSLGHIISGVSLAMDRAYKVGEKIELHDGTVGIVQDITLRSTRILTFDGDLLMIPNSNLANEPLYTFALPNRKTREQVDFGVEYGSDPEKVNELVIKTIKKIDGIMEEPAPSCLFMNMGDSALEMRAYFWVDDYPDAFMTKREATTAIYKALNKSKIGIPFPTRTVHIKK